MNRLVLRIVSAAILLLAFTALFTLYGRDLSQYSGRWHFPSSNKKPLPPPNLPAAIFNTSNVPTHHPIDRLINKANAELRRILEKQTTDLDASAAAYQKRRGRYPPPGFDKWFEYASSKNCIIVEDFFDQIYRDIEPFWGLSASDIRAKASSIAPVLRVRKGKAIKIDSKSSFVNAYFDMLKEIEKYLPDVDLPINEMDESRILLRWEDVNKLMVKSDATKNMKKKPSVTTYASLPEKSQSPVDYAWLHEGPYWNIAREGCHPKSAARTTELDGNFSTPPVFPSIWPVGTYNGFITNWTVAKDPCHQPHLRNLHGTFVEPISQSTSTTLLPMFSGSKLPFNNDILLPGAVYWNEDNRFTIDNALYEWGQKRTEVLWRGSASGGRNRDNNWTRFQRHRLLSMLNGTHIQLAMDAAENAKSDSLTMPASSTTCNGDDVPCNFPMPDQSLYYLQSLAQGKLPEWIRTLSNAAFTWLTCFPSTKYFGCSYTGAWYSQGSEMPFTRQFEAKFLPDVDGNSFSGRYRAFLRSNSLPIKATIYSEWHDDRLFAWNHFIPMDNTFVDLWAILEYLVIHDFTAQHIAHEGRQWAEKVLRKEDMLVYVYRVILEYARVSSDSRKKMGYFNGTTPA